MNNQEQLHFDMNIETVPPAVEYEILRGHKRTDGSWKSADQLRTEYVRLTDNLIHQISEGVEILNPETGEMEQKSYDYVVWLDKSARPLSWLTKELWPELSQNEDGQIPDMPKFKFVNIDREQWVQEVDPHNVSATNVDRVSDSIVRGLRATFLEHPHQHKILSDEVDSSPTVFDGKNILIVDEVRSSGRTLNYAESFFRRAFPDASSIQGTYWMAEHVTRNGVQGNADIPVWYSDTTTLGRGVANRNVDLSLKSNTRAQRLGARFLSVAFDNPDPKSLQLRKEFKQLAQDVHQRKIFIEPSRDRDEADYDRRALLYNGVNTFEEYLELLHEHKRPEQL